MSASLMLVLLESGYQGDIDYTFDFNKLGRDQKNLLLAALYNSLHRHIDSLSMANPIGTILARAISGDQTADRDGRMPRYHTDSLRHVLREEMVQHLDALMIAQNQGGVSASSTGSAAPDERPYQTE